MTYESKFFGIPERSTSFHSKDFLGYTNAATYPHDWDRLLRTVPPPEKQKAFNIARMRTEQVKTWHPLEFYNAGEVRRPLIKCTEWAEQRAIPALTQAGLICEDRL
jgi:hypothetical protein